METDDSAVQALYKKSLTKTSAELKYVHLHALVKASSSLNTPEISPA